MPHLLPRGGCSSHGGRGESRRDGYFDFFYTSRLGFLGFVGTTSSWETIFKGQPIPHCFFRVASRRAAAEASRD